MLLDRIREGGGLGRMTLFIFIYKIKADRGWGWVKKADIIKDQEGGRGSSHKDSVL